MAASVSAIWFNSRGLLNDPNRTITPFQGGPDVVLHPFLQRRSGGSRTPEARSDANR